MNTINSFNLILIPGPVPMQISFSEHYTYSLGKDEPIQVMQLKEASNVKRVANVKMSFNKPGRN